MKKYRNTIFYITLAVIVFLVGCTASLSKNFGKTESSAEVTGEFEQFQINDKLNYYISGSDVYPTSILGLNKAYILDTDLWKKIDMNPKLFSELVTNMRTRSLQCCGQSMHGFNIYDNNHNKIGVWYSLIGGSIVVQVKEEDKVVIFPPRDDEQYKAYEGRLGRSGGSGR